MGVDWKVAVSDTVYVYGDSIVIVVNLWELLPSINSLMSKCWYKIAFTALLHKKLLRDDMYKSHGRSSIFG